MALCLQSARASEAGGTQAGGRRQPGARQEAGGRRQGGARQEAGGRQEAELTSSSASASRWLSTSRTAIA